MLKKYRVYFKEGYQVSKKVLKNKGNLMRYYLIYLIDLLGTVLFPMKPITSIGVYRTLKTAVKGEDLSISKSVVGADSYKTYWSLSWAAVLKFMMLLAGIVLLAIPTAGLFFLGYGIYNATNYKAEILPYIFGLPGAIAIVVFMFVVFFATVPLPYIVDGNLSIRTSRALYTSVNAFKFGGRGTYILIEITKFFLSIVYIALAFFITLLLSELVNGQFYLLVLMLCIFVFLGLYIAFITRINLAFDIAKVNLLDDVLYDNVLGEKKLTGIKIEAVNESKKLNKLERLFEEDGSLISDNRYNLLRNLREINGTNTEVFIDESESVIAESAQTEEVVSGPVVETFEPEVEVQQEALPEQKAASENKEPRVSFLDKIKTNLKKIIPIKKEKGESDALEKAEKVVAETDSLEEAEEIVQQAEPIFQAVDAPQEAEPVVEEPEAFEQTEQIVAEAKPNSSMFDESNGYIDPEIIEKALSIEEPVIMTPEELAQYEEEQFVEEVIYVDEDGNPIELDENQEVIEEIIYVDEDGNPVELDGTQEIIEEIVEEKPKRGRKKKTVEDGE